MDNLWKVTVVTLTRRDLKAGDLSAQQAQRYLNLWNTYIGIPMQTAGATKRFTIFTCSGYQIWWFTQKTTGVTSNTFIQRISFEYQVDSQFVIMSHYGFVQKWCSPKSLVVSELMDIIGCLVGTTVAMDKPTMDSSAENLASMGIHQHQGYQGQQLCLSAFTAASFLRCRQLRCRLSPALKRRNNEKRGWGCWPGWWGWGCRWGCRWWWGWETIWW